MNVERLHTVLIDLHEETSKQNVGGLLNEFSNTFNQSISQPNPQTSEAFTTARENLWKVLKKSIANSLRPSSIRILATIGGQPFYGNGLMEALQNIIDTNTATPGQAVSSIQEHIKNADEFYAAVETANDALDKLNIEFDFAGEGEYEVGVLLPSKLFDNNIDQLGTELHLINRHMKVFGEIAGADASSPKIRSVSNSSFELFLDALPVVADFIADAIEYLVFMYLGILQIRKNREALKKSKVPDKALKPLADYEEQLVSDELKRITEELFKKHQKQKDTHRAKELKGHLRHALTYLAKRLDEGADFEVTPPSEPEDVPKDATEEQKKKAQAQQQIVKQILNKGKSAIQLPERKEQVLSLPEPEVIPEDKDEPKKETGKDK